MQQEPSISSTVVQSLCNAIGDSSDLTRRALRKFELTSITTTTSYHRVSLRRYLAMFEWLAVEMDRPNLGLEISAETGVETIGAVGYLFLSSGTLEQGLRSLVRNVSAIQDVSPMELSVDNRFAIVRYRVAHGNLAGGRQDNEYTLAFIWRLIQIFSANRCPLVQVDFEHSMPPDVRQHRSLFQAPVLFNQANNNIYLPLSAMSMTSAALDSHLYPILEAQVNESVALLAQATKFSDQVIQVLSDELLREGARAHNVAARMGISTATLHRRLRSESTSFKSLLDAHCKMLAQRMMSLDSITIATMARRLGYAESACLTRAFRRWFGMTPSQYRKHRKTLSSAAEASQ